MTPNAIQDRETPVDLPTDPDPGIPGLQIRHLLAKGGFAEVWEAEQVSLGRKVAVKILRHEHLGQQQMVQLFEQEARVLARLNHSNVVQVIDRGTCVRGPYFVMEFVEGETFQALIKKGRLTRQRALTILLHAARGLAYAHKNRVVHRDVKPANVLISRTGQIKIGDFGIAAVKAKAGHGLADDENEPEQKQALGTRAYMAPEQRVRFDEVGPQADVYSLGVILHRIVAGRLPKGPAQPALDDPSVPDALRGVIDKSLSEIPDERYPDAGRFREALINALEGAHLDDGVRRGAASSIGATGRFQLLDVIRQDDRRSVYLVSRNGDESERIVVKRYVRDTNAVTTLRELCRIEHENIVRIHAVGERADSFVILMEYLPGGDLRERLVRPHSWREAAEIGCQVAKALACAHAAGIVHGNLRPSNVLFDAKGRARVTDFGLPEHYAGEPGKRNWYAAPERGRSKSADLYALGAILYEMLHARTPPEDSDHDAEVSGPTGGVHPVFEAMVQSLLADDVEREKDAARVADNLQALLRGESPDVPAERPSATKPERRPAYGVALLGLAALALSWALHQPRVQVALESLATLLDR